MYLVFKNVGEIDPMAIKTFGVNVKESDNPFGFFGTGLKYAIAIILRRRNAIRIYSGKTVHLFSTRKTTVRGKEIQTVTMNRKVLGFTTEVGKTWKPWMAYRELRCNTLDEGGTFYESEVLPEPEEGVTYVVVDDAEILKVHRNSRDYFLVSKPIAKAASLDIHPGATTCIYYQGVRVASLNNAMRYTYNLKGSVELTEDRTAKSEYRIKHDIVSAIAYWCDDEEILDNILLAPENALEHSFDFTYCSASEAFAKRVGYHLNRGEPKLNRTAVKACDYRGFTSQLKDITDSLDELDKLRLKISCDFLASLGLDPREYPIKVVSSLGESVLGRAEDGTIFISKYTFDQGTKMLAGTLFEEWCHLKHGFSDETRNFQNFLIDKIMSMGERVLNQLL